MTQIKSNVQAPTPATTQKTPSTPATKQAKEAFTDALKKVEEENQKVQEQEKQDQQNDVKKQHSKKEVLSQSKKKAQIQGKLQEKNTALYQTSKKKLSEILDKKLEAKNKLPESKLAAPGKALKKGGPGLKKEGVSVDGKSKLTEKSPLGNKEVVAGKEPLVGNDGPMKKAGVPSKGGPLGADSPEPTTSDLPPIPPNPHGGPIVPNKSVRVEVVGTFKVDSKKLPQALMDKIVDRVQVSATKGGGMQFQFEMKGDVLGGMKMNVAMENGQLKVSFLSENPEIRQLLDDNMKDLQKNLQQRGIVVAQLEVNDPKEQQRQQQRQQNQKERQEFIDAQEEE